jgi:2-C-methyl-D-erythritol 4-phosphate cytidylyltransferase
MIRAGYYPASVTDVAVSSDEIVWTVVVGGGSGDRFGAAKQYEPLGSSRVLDVAVEAARKASDGVVVVVPAEDAAREHGIAGGPTRSASVRAGLAAVPDEATIICVHDAARPLATPDLFVAVVDAVHAGADGAVPALPVTDTIKAVDGTGLVVDTPERRTLVAVQTPQAFRAAVLRRAHVDGGDGTDDAALVERLGGRVVVVAGEAWNRKITEPDDLLWARRWLAERTA